LAHYEQWYKTAALCYRSSSSSAAPPSAAAFVPITSTATTAALGVEFVGKRSGLVLPPQGPVVIGSDSRLSGPMLVAALSAGLAAAGREVWQLGLCPTPAVPGTIRRVGAAGGLMVSASHNPPQDNGIKVFGPGGAKLDRERQRAIEAGLRRFDSSIGGLGGCPFAKGATGNVATEDVVYMLHGMGIDTGIDLDALIEAGQFISDHLQRPSGSRAARALLAQRH
jgi:hypothetical protein